MGWWPGGSWPASALDDAQSITALNAGGSSSFTAACTPWDTARASRESQIMAAVLLGGAGAVASHRSAAWLRSLLPYPAVVDVTVKQRRRRRPGIRLHERALPPDEVTVHDAIPVTTVPRTIFDLAAVLPPRQVERAISEAEYQRLTDPLSLQDMLDRHPRHRGVATVRATLARADLGTSVTRSELEEWFLAFLDRHGIERPRINAGLQLNGRWIEVDCVWDAHRLIVELDGRAAHATSRGFERDRARDRALQVAGWRVVRLTWRQLLEDAEAVAADLRSLTAA